ncbi:pantoate--beta-alanine ligase [Salinarimonas soli]|uniref:Pantothenate synthetase n=1 Tax=Salinarimonas soli TaxID=1638099 RepID=A0A5B2VB10_9HYPH|nr:pantoate--beta-alanine ligase [Salinarimonas soli]KAA2235966.1 pantoate--beta-alanine ligase [Salinarimonas soli]
MPPSPSPGRLTVVRNVADLRALVRAWRAAGETVGLVPTMGALHEGHLTLVRAALGQCDRAVATIFVNPKQFGPNEDYAAYPRGEGRDIAMLESAGAAALFAPGVEEMYPPGFATAVRVDGSLTAHLCGPWRPGHFEGVATVVAKLLLQALPDRAYFGEKDFQQLQVIRRMARDLDIPVAIEGVETVREADGLALSSRNAYLSPEERRIAATLPAVLRDIARDAPGCDGLDALTQAGEARLLEAGFDRVEYLTVNEAGTLAPASRGSHAARVFAAARLGRTRLIDNWPVTGHGA